jgi:hypothetical protein
MSPLLFNTGFCTPDSYNLFVILTHEYKNIWDDMKKSDKWYDKFMYVLPPGWSHDGNLTIKQIRYEMATAESGVKSQELQY